MGGQSSKQVTSDVPTDYLEYGIDIAQVLLPANPITSNTGLGTKKDDNNKQNSSTESNTTNTGVNRNIQKFSTANVKPVSKDPREGSNKLVTDRVALIKKQNITNVNKPVPDVFAGTYSTYVVKPRDDFRALPIYPNTEELTKKPKRQNVVEGPYGDLNSYLDVHRKRNSSTENNTTNTGVNRHIKLCFNADVKVVSKDPGEESNKFVTDRIALIKKQNTINASKYVPDDFAGTNLTYVEQPRNDIRTLPIYPSTEQVTRKLMRQNVVECPYEDLNRYFDVHRKRNSSTESNTTNMGVNRNIQISSTANVKTVSKDRREESNKLVTDRTALIKKQNTTNANKHVPDVFAGTYSTYVEQLRNDIRSLPIYQTYDDLTRSPVNVKTVSKNPEEKFKNLVIGRTALINQQKDDVTDVFARICLTDIEKPPNDFRTLPIYPTTEELTGKVKSFVRPNVVEGPYEDLNHYLDVHFRLYREDFVAELREEICAYMKNSNKNKSNLRIHKNVKFLDSKVVKDKTCTVVQFSTDSKKKEERDESTNEFDKRFMFGSLLCFTVDGFENIIFATVVESNEADLKKGLVLVDFVNGGKSCLRKSRCLMVECNAYFGTYYHVLKALQIMREDTFPMLRYIVKVKKSIHPPAYLREYPLMNIANRLINVLNHSQWPSDTALHFNKSQFEAFRTALTHEFVIIQGPPGTGKTFLSLKIIKTLLSSTFMTLTKSPILIVSYTNQALDKFLEGLLPFTKELIRYGGQSQSDALAPFNIKHKRKEWFATLRRGVDDIEILRTVKVVGMTTSCAARMRPMLENLKCRIVLVEEAAEILEAHVVSAVTASCQHLILVGDHKQLRPSTTNHHIGTAMKLGISLFERMVMNEVHYSTLSIQHRMKPVIANLIRPAIYKELQDSMGVSLYLPVIGVKSSLYFIDHEHAERSSGETSKENRHEAEFFVYFARYLILNGYKAEDITILAAYSGQKNLIDNVKSKLSYLEDVRVAVLDGFQGEECKIILLSLVRNNGRNSIGFLKNENRVCVALSRAKVGLYIMGNMNLLCGNSEIWPKIKRVLKTQSSLSKSLPLKCAVHNSEITHVQSFLNFLALGKGGCNQMCNADLICGHKCVSRCHLNDRDHSNYKCYEKCGKLLCSNPRHKCNKLCSNCSGKCGRCNYDHTLPCGHNSELL